VGKRFVTSTTCALPKKSSPKSCRARVCTAAAAPSNNRTSPGAVVLNARGSGRTLTADSRFQYVHTAPACWPYGGGSASVSSSSKRALCESAARVTACGHSAGTCPR
jgi:hypothetical protein